MSKRAEAFSSTNEVAEVVRDFYERYPYPRPLNNLDSYRKQWQDRQRRRADFHLFWPDREFREDHSILIAGCGTSQAAKHALRWPTARVVGIDNSGTSIRHTERLKEKYHLENLQVRQVAIEQLSELDMSFDHVVCTGVLHHLADPDVGLSALRRVLNLGGAMHLMVYAPYGRVGIYMLQEFCRRIGIQPTDKEITDLIAALCALPSGHPLQALLVQAPDFRNEAALADALLHPNDRPYNVSQLFELIEKAGLRFGRWVRQAPYSVNCGIMSTIPHAPLIARLPLKEQYATIELFRGTMIRHSAVLYRDDGVNDAQPIDFVSDAWLKYVPIRIPDTICVQEQLPPGAAAVLINRTHTYKDLLLPINETEMQIFKAVDGQRMIEEIIERTFSPSVQEVHIDQARTLFERLWWHDQVVFDASQQSRNTE
jgi:SAM-dependent methyltransferase